MSQDTIYTFLELNDIADFKSKKNSDPSFRIVEMAVKQWQFNKFLYELVGKKWHWYDKVDWSDSDWIKYVEDPCLHTSVGYHSGTVAGYYELHREGSDIQITYFGLAPAYIGKGLGGPLLSASIAQAYKLGAKRIWLSTCSLDHPHAINNYKARGMKIYDKERDSETDR